MFKVDTISKAISAALVAGLAVFDFSTVVQSAGGTSVTGAEWIRVAASAAIAGLAVYAVPNGKPPATL